MLPSKNRLKKESDFTSTLRGRSRVQEGFLYLKARANDGPDVRFGIIISKKVAKKAVERNRIHRVVSETLRDRIPEVKGGVDIVLVAGPDARDKDSAEIRQTTERLLKKADLI